MMPMQVPDHVFEGEISGISFGRDQAPGEIGARIGSPHDCKQQTYRQRPNGNEPRNVRTAMISAPA